MPLVQYCKKCRTEVPLGDGCPHCGGKLAKTAEQLSFGMKRRVVREWFAWNAYLRIALPAFLLVAAAIIAIEAANTGMQGVTRLFSQGFLETLLWLLAGMLAAIWLLLRAQGVESVHVVLDKTGVHVRTYIAENDELGQYARFMSRQAVEQLQETDDRPPLPGLMLVKRVTLPWGEIRRVRIWREGYTILFFRPSFWQVAAVRCPLADMAEAETMVRQKLKRFGKVRVQPSEKRKKQKKR